MGVVDIAGTVQMREVEIGSSMSVTHDRALHFGLGENTATHLVVTWADGSTQVVNSLPPRAAVSIEYP